MLSLDNEVIMHHPGAHKQAEEAQDKLLVSLEHLLSIDALNVQSALRQASDLLAKTLDAEKIDVFVFDRDVNTLVAMGVSNTDMAARQQALGLDKLPVANEGREVEVFETGKPYLSGHADLDTGMLPGVKYDLGVRSIIIVPLAVRDERRGLITAASGRAEAFNTADLRFLQGVSRWVGMVMHRAELAEQAADDIAESARQTTADEMVTVLAHDLNNFLTPISGRLDLVRRRALRDGRQDDLRDVNEASRSLKRLHTMINDLLDIERLDQGIVSIIREPVDLSKLVNETASNLQTSESPINVQVPVDREVVAQVDANRLPQALENLISNAVKHSPQGAPVEVRLQVDIRDDQEWAAITIRDQGPGIPSDLVPRLFERFAVGNNSHGLGMGLYVARSIARAHNGTLELDGEYKDGAGFRLSFPLQPPLTASTPTSPS